MDDPGQGSAPESMQSNAQPQPKPQAPQKGLSPFVIILIALAVIAIIVVFILPLLLVGLFSAGAFSSGGPTGGGITLACLAMSGYSCSHVSTGAGSISVAFSQDTGTTWQNVTLYAIPNHQVYNATVAADYPNSQAIPQLFSGQNINATISGGSGNYSIGSSGYNGQIWATYSSGNGGPYQTVVAIVTLK